MFLNRKESLMFKMSGTRVLAIALLLVVFGVLQMSCSKSSNPAAPHTSDFKVFTSTVVNGHSHTITIQKSELETPPVGGISRQTSVALYHSHSFAMTQAQLTAALTGPVVITTGITNDHTHDFTIQKWY